MKLPHTAAMADVFDDGEYLLPSDFLTEEDILNDFDISTPSTESTDGLNSPPDSVTETESDDEEDFVAGLNRRLSRSSLVPKRETVTPKERALPGSPKSTLQQGNSGYGSASIPTGPISPPPAPAYGDAPKLADSASLNLLKAAAGEVAKVNVKQQGTGYFDYTRGFPPASQWKQIGPVPANSRNPNFPPAPYPKQSPQQLQAFQFQQYWNREMMMKQRNKKTGPDFFPGGRPNHHHQNRPLGLPPAAWPTLQHAVNPKAKVFAPPAVMKRESVGTGVFLPRVPNSTATHIRKNTIKTDSGKKSQVPNSNNNSGAQAAAKRNSDNARSEGVANLDIQLPSEWTY